MRINIYIKTNITGFKTQTAGIAYALEAETAAGYKAIYKKEVLTGTINKINLNAVILALNQIKKKEGVKHDITIFLDSEYIGQTVNSGVLRDYNRRAFKKRGGDDMANKTEWQQLFNYINTYDLYFEPYADKYDQELTKLLLK